MEGSSQSTGVVLEFERAAMKNDPMPDGLCLVDQCMFQALANLYARYRLGIISREQARAEKGRMLYEYAKRKEQSRAESALAAWRANILKATEQARTQYRRERTRQAGDALCSAIEGVLTLPAVDTPHG